MANNYVIGIDLGTTYSCVGVYRNGRVEIIPNKSGNRTTPSFVSFTDEEIIVGDRAKELLNFNPENTVYDAKRLIGKEYEDPSIQEDMRHWPFEVILHKDTETNKNKPMIKVIYKGKTETFFPEQISGFVLEHMKQIAEDYLGREVTHAVITVPAYFTVAQRDATILVAPFAKLNVLQLIPEPTAAAIAYGLKNEPGVENILLCDIGGGTFDVSILNVRKSDEIHFFNVIGVDGDFHLGGEDFTILLVEHFIKEFEQKYEKIISNDDIDSRNKLKIESDKAKIALSEMKTTYICIDSLLGINFMTSIKRATFERLGADLFRRIQQKVEDALAVAANTAAIDKSDINQIVMVGGSSRIPKIHDLLKEFFGKDLKQTVHPDEAIAEGAAVQAAILNHVHDGNIENILVNNATSLSVGIEVGGHDVCGNFTSSRINSIGINNRSNSMAISEYGVQAHRGPKHSNYNSIDSRRRSYVSNGWDPRVPVSIDSLSEAGFFAIGISDYVKCFFCDGGLCNWELGDDPWIEHANYFPECNFVQLNKREPFIDAWNKLVENNRTRHNESDPEIQINSGSDTKELDNDYLGLRAVNEWMNSDIVKQLINLNVYSIEVIKAVLNRRWRLTKEPFTSFSELFDTISQWRNEPTNEISTPERQISLESNISSDDDYHSVMDIPSSLSSVSSMSSTLSPYPESSQESPKCCENPFTCKICYEREIGVVFLPCGHQLACTQCAACVTDCPICRKAIRGTVRTFFS